MSHGLHRGLYHTSVSRSGCTRAKGGRTSKQVVDGGGRESVPNERPCRIGTYAVSTILGTAEPLFDGRASKSRTNSSVSEANSLRRKKARLYLAVVIDMLSRIWAEIPACIDHMHVEFLNRFSLTARSRCQGKMLVERARICVLQPLQPSGRTDSSRVQ